MSILNYVIISPLKNEEAYVEETLKSVVSQTKRPLKWIIVDDGSTDRSAEIVDNYCREHPWITLLKMEGQRERQPGAPVVHAFNFGYKNLDQDNLDVIVKLDCDLSFDPEYFESILEHFERDASLGIASGIYFEANGDSWTPVEMPWYHTAGACKVIRQKCFIDIGGFVAARGWDTVDEIRAQYKGWATRHFKDLRMNHLKKEGSGIGSLKTGILHGEVYYLTGGSGIFFILKVVHRIIFGKPPILEGLAVLLGYTRKLIQKKNLLVTQEEGQFYKNLLNTRIKNALHINL